VWAGHVPPHEVAALARPGDIGVVPTRARHGEEFSASPLKLFEYMARGLPVVAADLPSLRDVVRDGENGVLFRDGDPPALADAVRRLLADPTRRAAIAAQARQDAGRYSWTARAQHILAFITTVRAHHPPGHAEP
jgi:glycosyltransferase involved in cell wall biosynthesis